MKELGTFTTTCICTCTQYMCIRTFQKQLSVLAFERELQNLRRAIAHDSINNKSAGRSLLAESIPDLASIPGCPVSRDRLEMRLSQITVTVVPWTSTQLLWGGAMEQGYISHVNKKLR